jgi:hypothetical protein
MSGAPRDPKSKQSGGDLKISLTPAGLFVVAMIVFFFAGGIFVSHHPLCSRPYQAGAVPNRPYAVVSGEAEFKKLFEDPTVALVVAAYADKQGSDEQNLQISKERATNLMKIL